MRTRDFESIMPDDMLRIDQASTECPSVEGWPDDSFSKWVASHRTEMQGLICREQVYKDSPFC